MAEELPLRAARMRNGGCERELADAESGEGRTSASAAVHDEIGACGAGLGVNFAVYVGSIEPLGNAAVAITPNPHHCEKWFPEF